MSERYFAYGSNLWIEQMVERTGPIRQAADRPRTARLPGHRLTFNVRGEGGHVFANVRSPGEGVLGVVYCCDLEALEKLDAYEQGYERRRVLVAIEDGETLAAFTYMAKIESVVSGRVPSVEYLQRIVRGARQHALPEAYIREIEVIARAKGE